MNKVVDLSLTMILGRENFLTREIRQFKTKYIKLSNNNWYMYKPLIRITQLET